MAVIYHMRYPLRFRPVEDILHERGIDIFHETVRCLDGHLWSSISEQRWTTSKGEAQWPFAGSFALDRHSISFDHIRCFFCDHNGWCIRISGD